MASLDQRVTRKYSDLKQQILSETSSSHASGSERRSGEGLTKEEVDKIMAKTRDEVEASVKAASKQLSSVRKGEVTMKKLISVQSRLSEQQHQQSEEKLQRLKNQGERLENMALKEKDLMRRTEDEQLEEDDGSEGPGT